MGMRLLWVGCVLGLVVLGVGLQGTAAGGDPGTVGAGTWLTGEVPEMDTPCTAGRIPSGNARRLECLLVGGAPRKCILAANLHIERGIAICRSQHMGE